MFLAPLGDLVVPSYIGFVCNAMLREDHDEVIRLITWWAIFLGIGSVSMFLNKLIFGYACERMGHSVRLKLFDTVIRKDITYFDETKSGEIISRIASDTMIIQEGLSTSVAMFLQMLTFCIVVIIIMFFYDISTTFVSIGLIIPGALVMPVYASINRRMVELHQSAKSKANGVAEESISNIRKV
jgi:ABC-type multidrug transport system fused ATPase/permease subunit